jgi:hypothetical protein
VILSILYPSISLDPSLLLARPSRLDSIGLYYRGLSLVFHVCGVSVGVTADSGKYSTGVKLDSPQEIRAYFCEAAMKAVA